MQSNFYDIYNHYVHLDMQSHVNVWSGTKIISV